ncbi:MAG: glycosyltransferase family 39 protein [Candidatus Altiarchaeota archaeon]
MERLYSEKYRTLISLSIILLVSAFFRIHNLSINPNGFYHDEASNGYDAYSILETGRDRYGVLFPLFTRSFGDYDDTLYRFITAPFTGVFGLNEFAVRLPAAIIGVLTVFVVYLLSKELFDKKVAFLSAFLLAVNPWHVQFSRAGYGTIMWPFFFCIGLFFFEKSLRNQRYLIYSASAFAITLNTYMAARVFIPLFVFGLTLMHWKRLKKIKSSILIASAIIFSLIFLYDFQHWMTPEGMSRTSQVLTTTVTVKTLVSNYLSYFTPEFLFLNGSPYLRYGLQGFGELHFFELITVLAGVALLFTEIKQKHMILILWLFLYPIPAALTAGKHPGRSFVGAPLFAILSAYGLSMIYYAARNRLRDPIPRKLLLPCLSLIILISALSYWTAYFKDYPQYSSDAWQYGVREAILYAQESQNTCVYISDKIYHSQIFVLYYTKYPPEEYQKSPLYYYGNYTLGKYHGFSTSDNLELNDTCLLIIKADELSKISGKYDSLIVKEINYGGTEIIKLIEATP